MYYIPVWKIKCFAENIRLYNMRRNKREVITLCWNGSVVKCISWCASLYRNVPGTIAWRGTLKIVAGIGMHEFKEP